MAAPTQLNITLTSVAGGGTIVVPIPMALRDQSQSGLNAADVHLGTILKGGRFWNAAGTVAYTAYQIASVTYS